MQNVILVIHILVGLAMVGVVLVQRSEGGALGIGGGSGGGGLMSGRGAAGALVRTTIILGTIFFVTSLTLTTFAARSNDGRSAVERTVDERIEEESDISSVDRDLLAGQGDLITPAFDPLAETSIDPLAETSIDPLAETPVDPLATETPQQ